jgi:hypothetical protein
MQISPNFHLAEFEASQTAARRGLDNAVPLNLYGNLERLAQLLEHIRAAIGKPITLTSGYRSPALNRLVGGSKTSAHMDARAADLICPAYGTPRQIARHLAGLDLAYDQIIEEGTWLHVAVAKADAAPRRQLLTARFDATGRATYTQGLT